MAKKEEIDSYLEKRTAGTKFAEDLLAKSLKPGGAMPPRPPLARKRFQIVADSASDRGEK